MVDQNNLNSEIRSILKNNNKLNNYESVESAILNNKGQRMNIMPL